MNEVQEVILDIFKEIIKICERHKLRYYAIGGTCIGAIRHNGFIPWDDDMDLAMPYEDYRKFLSIAKKELLHPYELYLPEEHPNWMGNYIKVHNVETAYCEQDCLIYPDRMTGVNVDIMPIYGMPKSIIKREICQIKNDYYHYMNRRLKSPATVSNRIANLFFRILSSVNGSKKDNMYYCKKIDSCFGKYSFFESDKVLFGWRDRIVNKREMFNYMTLVDASDFKSTVDIPFENEMIKVPSGFDHYLSIEFGDYMILPPKEKQKTHQPKIVDLLNSYKKYQEENNK